LLVAVIAAAALAAPHVAHRSDTHLATNETKNRLAGWRAAVVLATRAGEDLTNCKSIDEAADRLVKIGIIFPSERDKYVEDFWRQPLVWHSSRQYGFIAVYSVGPNGVWEWGGGDDLVIRLECADGQWVEKSK
jgi:hypothetical protein